MGWGSGSGAPAIRFVIAWGESGGSGADSRFCLGRVLREIEEMDINYSDRFLHKEFKETLRLRKILDRHFEHLSLRLLRSDLPLDRFLPYLREWKKGRPNTEDYLSLKDRLAGFLDEETTPNASGREAEKSLTEADLFTVSECEGWGDGFTEADLSRALEWKTESPPPPPSILTDEEKQMPFGDFRDHVLKGLDTTEKTRRRGPVSAKIRVTKTEVKGLPSGVDLEWVASDGIIDVQYLETDRRLSGLPVDDFAALPEAPMNAYTVDHKHAEQMADLHVQLSPMAKEQIAATQLLGSGKEFPPSFWEAGGEGV